MGEIRGKLKNKAGKTLNGRRMVTNTVERSGRDGTRKVSVPEGDLAAESSLPGAPGCTAQLPHCEKTRGS